MGRLHYENCCCRTSEKPSVASKRMAGAVGVAAATGAVEITLPVAIVAAAYIIGQAFGRVFSTVDLPQ